MQSGLFGGNDRIEKTGMEISRNQQTQGGRLPPIWLAERHGSGQITRSPQLIPVLSGQHFG